MRRRSVKATNLEEFDEPTKEDQHTGDALRSQAAGVLPPGTGFLRPETGAPNVA